MTEQKKNRLTLDQLVQYSIVVPGYLNEEWSDWIEGLSISVEVDMNNQPITTLSCCLDQAGLQGLLRRLYALGLPLISVSCAGGHNDGI